MLETRFTRLVGCAVPLQQAGMGGVATVELATAVAQAGALGMIGGVMVPGEMLAAQLDAANSSANEGAVGVNFLMPFLDHDAVEAVAGRARVVEFFYDNPDARLVETVHGGGALAAWQVGSIEEARAAAEAGCDLVVVQGVEAGGHVRGKVGLLPLLSETLDTVEVPVVAAGGIGTARAAAAALSAGADAVRVGTRFVAAREASTHPAYAAALIESGPEDTVLTEAFSVMWPNAPHRVLRSCVEAANSAEDEIVGEIELAGEKLPVPRLSVPSPTRAATGTVEAMALYAGQSVGAVERVEPAAEIVKEIVDGAERLLREAAWVA
jgi:nitronate monooxygenase